MDLFGGTTKESILQPVPFYLAGELPTYYCSGAPAIGIGGGCIGRYIIEFGMGTDFHGQDVTKAAVKAVRDAISRSCLCGLREVLALEDLDRDVKVTVTVALESVAACLPVGEVTAQAVGGGLHVPGLYLPKFGDTDDSIEVAVAVVEVFVYHRFPGKTDSPS